MIPEFLWGQGGSFAFHKKLLKVAKILRYHTVEDPLSRRVGTAGIFKSPLGRVTGPDSMSAPIREDQILDV
jgi:hypothetical protein